MIPISSVQIPEGTEEAVLEVLRSGMLAQGPMVRRFEETFAELVGVRHAIAVNNGTTALVAALQVLDLEPGDEVLTSPFTFVATLNAILEAGATAVFADIRTDDFCIDPAATEAAVGPRTKVLMPVHLYGQCADMAPLRKLAEGHGLALVEDCAQAHGARHHGRRAGTMSDAAAFSFYPTKVLGAYGDGGAVLTRDEDVDGNLRRLRYYGMAETYYVVQTPGHNSRLDEVQAEILRRKLPRLDAYVEGRRAVARRYAEGLGDLTGEGGLTLPATAEGNEHVYYVYVVRHPRRDEVIERLKKYDISLNISYPWPVHTMTGFAHLGVPRGSLPVTERLAGEIFSLPMYPSLARDEQDRVIAALREVLAGV